MKLSSIPTHHEAQTFPTVKDANTANSVQLAEITLDADDKAYIAATAAMNEAIAETQAAIKGLQSIVNAIKVAAKAIDLAARVLPAG